MERLEVDGPAGLPGLPKGGSPLPVAAVGARQVEHGRRAALVGQERGGRHHLGQDGPAGREDHVGRSGRPALLIRLDQPVAAGEHVGPQRVVAQAGAGGGEGRLVERAGRQAEVQRVAVGRGEAGQPVAQQPVQRHRVGRLGQGQPGQLHPDRRRDRRLVRPSLRSERDARRRADHDEAGAVVERVDQGVEAAADERVVDGADRQQVLAVQLVTEAQRVQGEEEVHLADAQLDVVAGGLLAPAQQPFGAQEVALRLGAEHAHLVDPAAEVGGDADVGRRRDQARRDLGMVAEGRQQPPERLLGRDRLARDGSGLDRDGQAGPGWDRPVVERAADRLAQPGLGRSGREAVPLGVGRRARPRPGRPRSGPARAARRG